LSLWSSSLLFFLSFPLLSSLLSGYFFHMFIIVVMLLLIPFRVYPATFSLPVMWYIKLWLGKEIWERHQRNLIPSSSRSSLMPASRAEWRRDLQERSSMSRIES
jgi:hypothetical protein